MNRLKFVIKVAATRSGFVVQRQEFGCADIDLLTEPQTSRTKCKYAMMGILTNIDRDIFRQESITNINELPEAVFSTIIGIDILKELLK